MPLPTTAALVGILLACGLPRGQSSPARAAGPSCAGVRVQGTTGVAAELRETLARLAIEAATRDRCAAVRVSVAAGDDTLRVSVTDEHERKGERVVPDVATAAIWVETWFTAPDLLDPLSDQVPTAPPAVRERPEQSVSAQQTKARAHALGFSVGLLGGAGLSGDGTAWGGARLRGCAVIGPICLGGTLAAAWAEGDDQHDSRERLFAGSLAATLEKSLSLGGNVALTPGLSIGATWQRTTTTVRGRGEQALRDEHDDRGDLELGLSLRITVPLYQAFAFEAGVFFAVTPLSDSPQVDSPGLERGRNAPEGGGPQWILGLAGGVQFGDSGQ